MLATVVLAVLGSAAVAYLIGYAYAAPRDSQLRTKRGVLLLVVLGGTFLMLPPQLTAMSASDGTSGLLGGVGLPSALAWPAGLNTGAYLAIWVVTSVGALLAGVRIWQLGTPEWRSGTGRDLDASPASRAASLVPLADRIEDALDTLGRAGLTQRDLPRVSTSIREVGARFADSLPPSDGEVYRLVAARVPVQIAATITGLLLEGAGRRRSGA